MQAALALRRSVSPVVVKLEPSKEGAAQAKPKERLQNAVFQYLVSTNKYGSASELYKEANLAQYYAPPLNELLQASQWNESNNLLVSIWNDYLATHHPDTIASTPVSIQPLMVSATDPTSVPPTFHSHNHDINHNRFHNHKTHFHPHGHGLGHGHDHRHHFHSHKRTYTAQDADNIQSAPESLDQNVNSLSLNPPILTTTSTTTTSTDTDLPTFVDSVNIPGAILPTAPTESFFQIGSPGLLTAALQTIVNNQDMVVPMAIPDSSPLIDQSSSQETAPNSSNPEDPSVARFNCNYPGCNKSFSTSAILKRHIKEHSGERPFSCSVEGCSKRFARKYDLKVHMRSHTGEKPYSCTFPGCERKFSRSSDLRLHGDKPFICDCEGCRKRFVRYADLKKHKRTHEVHEGHHPHRHGAGCGHTAIAHEDHIDYLHDHHLHNHHHDRITIHNRNVFVVNH